MMTTKRSFIDSFKDSTMSAERSKPNYSNVLIAVVGDIQILVGLSP